MGKRAWIEVDLAQISANIEKIKKYTGGKFMACVKADCYGMGMCRIAKAVEKNADFFGVAETSEALALRKSGIKKPVLVMGSVFPEDVEDLVMKDIRITLCSREVLKKVDAVTKKRGRKANVHVKVDTGLGRIGVMPGDAPGFIEEASKVKGLALEGIFTHLATADSMDHSYAEGQIEKFDRVLRETSGFKIPMKHIANSASIINFPETYKNFDMVRIGLLFLGVYPAKYLYEGLPLESALKGYCRVMYIKDVPRGTPLSYGITYRTDKKTTRVATVGLGYGDGFKRFLSNRYSLEHKGKKLDILGNICMDQTLLDITGTGIKVGDEIRVIGDDFEVENMAAVGKTVPQEILCGFGSLRMEKIYKK